ncbi:MAG TPA: hypothetical protein VKB80_28745 [Kofleriaceae bacterium]|nr:hypothetical protein [Kofleriaceae bacterium]
MQHRSPVVLIEFNELTPRLMERWMHEGKLPNFQRFYGESQVYRTDAEEEGEALNPWVQWVTVHTGLPLSRHGVFSLNDTRRLKFPQIWDVLSEAGQDVFVCGSMNAGYRPGLRGFVVPDPWSVDVAPYPAGEFEPYYEFIKKNVQEYSRTEFPVTPSDAARFALFMARHGLSLDTIRSGVGQLWGERRSVKSRWKRASIMDRLQWDVFRWYWSRHRPAFSTFFLNSTAHYQHMYWRTMEPEQFEIKPTAGELAATSGAILHGYQAMDDLLGRFVEMGGNDATLLFVTGLSQQPYLKAEAKGGKRFYRLRDGKELGQLGVRGAYSYEPVMADEFFVRFEREEDARHAAELLPTFRVQGEEPLRLHQQRGAELFLQCRVRKILPDDAMLEAPGRPPVRYYDVFHLVEGLKSGYHHPDGMMWMRRPDRAHAVHDGPVSIRAIAPGVLEMLGVAAPDFMDCPSFLDHGKAAAPARATV